MNVRNLRWITAAAATLALLAALAVVLHLRLPTSQHASLASLVTASSGETRVVEPRLSGGFRWAPLRRASSQSRDAAGVALAAVRGRLAGEGHVAGLADLLVRQPRRALATLSAQAESTDDPQTWSDVAAASYETAAKFDAPELLADGLAACDHALGVDPNLPEALFNRALILERLQLRDDAREAWRRYLASDGQSEWAVEARTHFEGLRRDPEFMDRLDRSYDRIRADSSAARELVALDPQNARGVGPMKVFARWGRAVLSGDPGEGRHLAVVRALGAEIERFNSDRTVATAVAAIDRADASARATIASAYIDYESGLAAFGDGRPGDAEPLLRRAAAGFERGGSPAAVLAKYFAANTAYEQGRHDQAGREIESLLAIVPADRPAVRAQLLWELGVVHTSRGDWGRAIEVLNESASMFDRLREVRNAGAVRRIIAFVYDRVGDVESAWKQRMLALPGVGRRSDIPLQKTLSTIAEAAMLRGKWASALSFLTLEIDVARRMGTDRLIADSLLLRGAVREKLHDDAGARADLRDAEAIVGRVKDPTYRDGLGAMQWRVKAILSQSPAEAETLLTDAIAYQKTKSDLLELPSLYLERGRARRGAGSVAAAAADFEAGMAELEKHRNALPQGEARWGAFHAAEELFDDAIDVAIERGDAVGALSIAERARARALLDAYGVPPIIEPDRIPKGTVVVEYAALRSRLIVMIVEAGGVRATTVNVDRPTLESSIQAFAKALRANDSVQIEKMGSILYGRLAEPAAPELLSAAKVVFVPDATTALVPFPALIDAHGDYLIERQPIVVAASAASYVAGLQVSPNAEQKSALVVAASEAGTAGAQLDYAREEASRVARLYRSAVRLEDDEAEFSEVAKRAETADVIHFSGHAIGDDSGLEPASIVLRQNAGERRVRAEEVAKLRLSRRPVVVLAGCNTARGERRASEGVISVARGFLTAGASSVIATLWPIDDRQAADLFSRLHEQLARSVSPAEALRAVQRDAIRRGNVPPAMWAALQDDGT